MIFFLFIKGIFYEITCTEYSFFLPLDQVEFFFARQEVYFFLGLSFCLATPSPPFYIVLEAIDLLVSCLPLPLDRVALDGKKSKKAFL
jgi:hypothetical protein